MTENLLLTHLIALRSDLKSMRGEMHEGFADLKARMSDLEAAVVAVKRDVNHGDYVDARLQVSLDKITERVQRIERRLDLAEAPDVGGGGRPKVTAAAEAARAVMPPPRRAA